MSDGFDLDVVWGKSDPQVCPTHWLPLYQHLADAEAVAGALVDRWVSPQVSARIARDLPHGLDGVRALVCWLAAVHDVGKVSPAFAVQVRRLADRMLDHGLGASPQLQFDQNRSKVRHELVGHLAVRRYLVDHHRFDRVAAEQLACVVGSHHGVPPEHRQLKLVREEHALRGQGVWEQARTEFLRRATAGVDLGRYRSVRLSKPSQVLLTAIVIMADWIASSAELFPLLELHEERGGFDTSARVERAWRKLALPERWRAGPVGTVSSDVDAAFRARFGIEGACARPVQVAAVEVAAGQGCPGLMIVEAPMGVGKTEAALLAVEELAARSGADGCFVALPTQATTDAMFDRVRRWVEALPGRDGAVSVTLAHGKASLNDEFAGLVREGWFRSIGEGSKEEQDAAAAVAHHWLSGRKKGALAAFVVGTIDQVLFAGLKSRHLMLRHLALAGKVVVIDEVHAYDVYMSQYLHRVLHWLGAYKVPVVLLSATLPADRRAELLAAYEGGQPSVSRDLGYPVVVASGGVDPRPVPAPDGVGPVVLDRLPDDLDSLVGYLRKHLVEGGCAVVVRNTVTRVQEAAQRLEQEFGAEGVTVTHARFLACDRARKDLELLRRFGRAKGHRPELHIVVASQVVEQSLDVDFDVMVTDLAPTDLVLQRLGRLHRHERGRPGPLAVPRCALVGVDDWAAHPVRAVEKSRRIYGDHLLLRSAALLFEAESVHLPSDIAPLVQRAYGDEPLGPTSWQPAMREAEQDARTRATRRMEEARTFLLGEVGTDTDSLTAWVRAGVGDVGDTEDRHTGAAQVRDGEESLEVLVVQRDAHGGLLTPPWIERGGGEQIPLDMSVDSRQAKVIAACALRLPVAMSQPWVIDDVIAALERNVFTSFSLAPLLKGQLVLVLDENREAVVEHGVTCFRLRYDEHKGLTHERG
ncbi:CRISPR-associated helicase Cas3' [Actinosynnema sp. CS-041913]|uniref:CRISPR-associated helicase Cas3' n=1 Tax=Actinosynnema sp. CS-041913 TaxID=3239917 RepID=UPI003D92C6D0